MAAQRASHAEVWGHPIAHSLSPALHRAGYVASGLTEWSYEARDVTSEQLAEQLAARRAALAGLSLTMPLKQSIVPLLDELHPLAARTGVVNTVVFRDGRAKGFNTDVTGIVEAVRPHLPAEPVLHALVLGSGATALSAIVALATLGAATCQLVCRAPDRVDAARRLAERCGLRLQAVPWGTVCQPAELAVSTLPGDVAGDIVATQDAALPTPTVAALDVAYPAGAVGARWAARGATVVPGTEMLLHQAAEQFQLMTGHSAPLEAMRAALPA